MSLLSCVWAAIQVVFSAFALTAALCAGAWGYNQAEENFFEGFLTGLGMCVAVLIIFKGITQMIKKRDCHSTIT